MFVFFFFIRVLVALLTGLFNRSSMATGSFTNVQDDRAGAGGEGKKGAATPLPFFFFLSSILTTMSS